MADDFDKEGFTEFSRTDGEIKVEFMGQPIEKGYSSKNSINTTGTIGLAEVSLDDQLSFMLLSKVDEGKVMTVSGDQDGPLPFQMEGFKVIMSVKEGNTAEAVYERHISVLGEDRPIADEAWLREEVPRLPQTATEIAAKVFEEIFGSMGDLMEGLGEAMGQMAQGLGEAMSSMGEGLEGPEVVIDLDAEEGECPACHAKIKAGDKKCPSCGKEI